ncbi:Uncharacterized protein HZ326_24886 [Fusarium oxysporum f. sp. albedinis]|nr:Uncharacterized protein HZ326_24886 [Fusarium oxysporum f. sp. albedinis]
MEQMNKQSYEHDDNVVDPKDVVSSAVDDYVPGSKEEKKLVRKINLYNVAHIASINKDLNFNSNKYSVILVVFFISYILFKLFIIKGPATIGVTVIAYFILLDFPLDTSCLKFSEAEIKLAIQRLQSD